MAGKPKVTVLIPIYNAERFLRQCIESVMNQRIKDIEILCLNDGSTDSSSRILAEYAKKDARIHVIDKENTGYGHTMNRGLAMATGEYVGIVESDDYVPQAMYAELYALAKRHDADVVKADFYRFYTGEDGKEVKVLNCLTDERAYYNRVLRPMDEPEVMKLKMNTWSGIYRREFLEKHGIRHNESPGASFQDNGFWFQTFLFAERAYFYDHAYYMNRRDNLESSVFSRSKVYAMCEEYAFIDSILRGSPERRAVFLPYFMLKKLHNYEFTYRRIAGEYKEDFFHRFHKEFLDAREKGELVRDVFTDIEWARIEAMLESKNAYYYVNAISELEARIGALSEELRLLKGSVSFRAGRMITAPLRLTRDALAKIKGR